MNGDYENAEYCAAINELMSVLDDDGTGAEYDAAPIRVGDATIPTPVPECCSRGVSDRLHHLVRMARGQAGLTRTELPRHVGTSQAARSVTADRERAVPVLE